MEPVEQTNQNESLQVIASKYKLLRDESGFSKELNENRRLVENSMYERAFVNQNNEDYKNTGIWFVIDEEKTAEVYKKAEIRNAELRDAEKLELEGSKAIGAAVSNAKKIKN